MSPDDLWRSLIAERDATAEFPTDRGWNLDALLGPDPDAPGATYVRAGSFIDNVVISTRRSSASVRMRPRQWTRNSGSAGGNLGGAGAGRYQSGITARQRYRGLHRRGAPGVRSAPLRRHGWFAGHLTTGTAICVASGRVAYTLGLQGPAVTVDTACSSSLVSLHLAVRSLRSGECGLALAGGVSVVCSPSIYIGFGDSMHWLPTADPSRSPRRRTGSVLPRASECSYWLRCRAPHTGYPVLALIRGSALGQDGASQHWSTPSGPAQQRVIRKALSDADLNPCDIDVVEAHGGNGCWRSY